MVKRTSKRSFKYTEAEHRTSTKIRLREHVMTHIAERFSCPECEYRAPTKAKLQEHMVTHTTERPTACEYRTSTNARL